MSSSVQLEREAEQTRTQLSATLGELRERITPGQLVALRFAGDAELPTLARKVLDERLQDRKAIKAMVKDWQADDLRA